MNDMVHFLDDVVNQGKKIMIHCVGGLGRSGMVAASYLKFKGINAEDAIEVVRAARGPRAIESRVQEEFVQNVEFA